MSWYCCVLGGMARNGDHESAAESKDEDVVTNSQNNFKPGQKYPTPSPGSGDRVFYDTLYHQRPESEMAQEWCVYHGTLDLEEAIKTYRLICKRKNREFDYKPTTTPAKKATTERNQRASSSRSGRIIDETNETIDTGKRFLSSLPISLLNRSRSLFDVGGSRFCWNLAYCWRSSES
jgi:hypothetical protein